MTKIYYYISPSGENPVSDFLDSLTEKQQEKILKIFKYIKEYGVKVPLPQIKKFKGSPLWEIRILGKDNLRVIYATVYGGDVLVLHGFKKKKQKTPPKELQTALDRYKSWLERKLIDA